MVLELKDKLFDESEPSVVSDNGQTRDRREESSSALQALGFRKQDANKVVSKIISKSPDAGVSDIVKQALSEMKR